MRAIQAKDLGAMRATGFCRIASTTPQSVFSKGPKSNRATAPVEYFAFYGEVRSHRISIQRARGSGAPTLFFAAGFNLIVLTIDLILADYLRTFASFLVATTTALVVGKSVLVADAMPSDSAH
jgi:hypothetical protein